MARGSPFAQTGEHKVSTETDTLPPLGTFSQQGVVSCLSPCIAYAVDPSVKVARDGKKRRRDNRKQELAILALKAIGTARTSGYHLYEMDGSAA